MQVVYQPDGVLCVNVMTALPVTPLRTELDGDTMARLRARRMSIGIDDAWLLVTACWLLLVVSC